MSRVQTCPIDLSEFNGATYKAAIELPGTLPSRAPAAPAPVVHAHVRRSSEISSSSCRSIEECDNESLARDLFEAASLATAHENQLCASEEDYCCDTNTPVSTATAAAAAVVDFEGLRVTEPEKLRLRLPAAAMHRRARSLGATLPRPSS
jgi:hypothetical protein